MPRKQLNQRNALIYEEFRALKQRHFETAFVLSQLSKKYFLSPDYLYKIIREEAAA